jgi:hypothetical protein
MPRMTRSRETRERETRVEGRLITATVRSVEPGREKDWVYPGMPQGQAAWTKVFVHARDASGESLEALQAVDRVLQRELRGSLSPDSYGYQMRAAPRSIPGGKAIDGIVVEYSHAVHDSVVKILEPLVTAAGEPRADRYIAISVEEFERRMDPEASKSYEGPFSSVDAAAEFISAEFGVDAFIVDLGELGAKQYEVHDSGKRRDSLALDRIVARGRPLARSHMSAGKTLWKILSPEGRAAAAWT